MKKKDKHVEIHYPFQTPIFIEILKGLAIKLRLENFVKKLHGESKFSKTAPLQSRRNLHEDKKLKLLCLKIYDVLNLIAFDIYKYSKDYKLEITEMWSNIQKPGVSFRKHCHYNNIFSGVFYTNEDEDFPPITFCRPEETTLEPLVNKFNILNQNTYFCKAKKDTLIIFPAWLQHYVECNETAKTRFSISFNVMLRGKYYNTVL